MARRERDRYLSYVLYSLVIQLQTSPNKQMRFSIKVSLDILYTLQSKSPYPETLLLLLLLLCLSFPFFPPFGCDSRIYISIRIDRIKTSSTTSKEHGASTQNIHLIFVHPFSSQSSQKPFFFLFSTKHSPYLPIHSDSSNQPTN